MNYEAYKMTNSLGILALGYICNPCTASGYSYERISISRAALLVLPYDCM